MADVCRWCDCKETVTRKCTDISPHYAGLFCAKCNRWIKWLPKPKFRNGYAVVHIVSDVMEACEVFMNPDAASDRQAEMLDQIWDEGGWEEWFEDDPAASRDRFLEFYNDSGDRLLTIEECKVIPDDREV